MISSQVVEQLKTFSKLQYLKKISEMLGIEGNCPARDLKDKFS